MVERRLLLPARRSYFYSDEFSSMSVVFQRKHLSSRCNNFLPRFISRLSRSLSFLFLSDKTNNPDSENLTLSRVRMFIYNFKNIHLILKICSYLISNVYVCVCISKIYFAMRNVILSRNIKK